MREQLRILRHAGTTAGPALIIEAAAEHAVERHAIAEHRELRRDQRVLRRVESARRDQGGKKWIDARSVARDREIEALLRGLDEGDLTGELLVDRRAHGERVGDLAEGGLDRVLVRSDQALLLDLRVREVRADRAAVEQRHREARRECPYGRGAGEQRCERDAGKATARGERERREELRARGAYVRVRRLEVVLGGEHVGALEQDLRRQPARERRRTSRAAAAARRGGASHRADRRRAARVRSCPARSRR